MNTKEAIMFLENTLYFCIGEEDDMPEYQSKYNHWIKEVISLLQQGEKYREMWHSLKYDMCRMEEDNWLNTIYELEQKYFPAVDDIMEIINLVTGVRFDVTEFWKELDDRQKELFKKCFVKEE